MTKLKHFLLRRYVSIIGSKKFYRFNKRLYMMSLHGIGILNSITPEASGEKFFLDMFLKNSPESIIFDVGANQGSYARMIINLSDMMQIYAFEPHPRTYQILAKEAERYNFKSYNIGLSDKPGTLELFDHRNQDGSTHATLYKDVIKRIHKDQVTEHKVRLTTIDHFMDEHQVPQIDLLKIDTEGNELNVLKGAQRMIGEGRVNCIQFEFNEFNVISRVFMSDIIDLLPRHSFYRLLPDGFVQLNHYKPIYREIFAYQNIIAIERTSPIYLLIDKLAIN
ncbi:MAG TPA: FkbM family methyltransferase [Caldithrix sp.]|nr:FkbM family methyltransferase [Caldithrix sp.]